METHCNLDAFSIIYQDDDFVAIHKPAGLLVHRSPIDKHETQFAVQITRDTIGQQVFPIHRLDKPTSGLLLFALNPDAARNLSDQFMEHSIEKTYVALCRGWTPENGDIDKPLKYHKDKLADKDKRAEDILQDAFTHYERLATTQVEHKMGRFEFQRYSLVKLQPKTGRKHQLRRHLNHISHPIIGDVQHGDRHHNHFFNQWLGQHRLYLAATSLQFTHPTTGETMTLNAPLEASFTNTLNKLWPNQELNPILD
ncbi:pseudouridine synthase [Hydrogenovibrio kuenenii]|uniref:pseudouridine synthase n=1 Tax=Hydrogenovibrio kuenenii TaxID=63658 RepID=UPI0004658BE1|nr:pseudouridine synthase [Hydrogenovibrio kuenenii]